MRIPFLFCVLGLVLGTGARADNAARLAEVEAAERAFAATMAARDLAGFLAHVAEDAVFLNGGQPLHGRAAIGAHWAKFYEGPDAPFSWAPELVVVNAAGDLAQSIGPVHDPAGTLVARFYSTWRRDPDGRWRVVFDNGYDACPTAAAADP